MNDQDASITHAEGLRLQIIASVESMQSKGPIGNIQRIDMDRQLDVHLITDATYQTKAFLVPWHPSEMVVH